MQPTPRRSGHAGGARRSGDGDLAGRVISAFAIDLTHRHALLSPGRWSNALDTRSDHLLEITGLLIWLGLGLARRRPWRSWAIAPVIGALTVMVWRGHSGDDPRWWATLIGAVHVAAAGAWAGALVHLTHATRTTNEAIRPRVAPAAARYSRLAGVAVVAALAAGTVVAATRFTRVGLIGTSTYGRILIVKLVLVAAALATAAVARRRGLPATGARLVTLTRITRIEVVLVTAVVGASAVLATTAPPTPAGGITLGPTPITNAIWSADLAGNNLVLVAATAHQLHVRVVQPGGQPPTSGRPQISGRQPDGSLIHLSARDCGPGCATIEHTWSTGLTRLDIAVPDADYSGGIAHTSIEWPPSPTRVNSS